MKQHLRNIWRILKWATREIVGELKQMVQRSPVSDDHYSDLN